VLARKLLYLPPYFYVRMASKEVTGAGFGGSEVRTVGKGVREEVASGDREGGQLSVVSEPFKRGTINRLKFPVDELRNPRPTLA
jgi:hypothetical protein